MLTGHKNRFVSVCLLFLACFTLLAANRTQASAADQVDNAVVVAKAWVGEIDAAKYEDSYNFACEETRHKFPEDQWVEILKVLREPWGSVVTRHQLSHVYKPNGVTGLEGECVVITYNTDFKNLKNALEQITLKWEDGHWRGAEYYAGASPDPNAVPPEPNYTTEVQTDEHVPAKPQSPSQ